MLCLCLVHVLGMVDVCEFNAGLVVRVIDESKLGGAKSISLSADLP